MTNTGLDRRGLLTLSAAALAVGSARAAPGGERGAHRGVIVNALGGLENPNVGLGKPETETNALDLGQPDVDDRAIRDALASGTTAVNVTLGFVAGNGDPFETSVRTVAVWNTVLRRNRDRLLKVDSAADILRARDEGKVGIIYGFQNAEMMKGDALRADVFAGLGVKIIQLTYNLPNSLGGGSMDPQQRGLTPFGREVIERLNANRVMVDLSHSGRTICMDAARASKRPISINHTGCRALNDVPRNKTDEELRLVADKGGFVGIYFMPFLKADSAPDATDVVAHIEHAVNVCGEDHVGIGTDGGTTAIDDMPAYDRALVKVHEQRKAAGVAAPGEGPKTYPFVLDLQGPDQFRKLARMLRARGHAQARIDKILGGNFLRYAGDVWGA